MSQSPNLSSLSFSKKIAKAAMSTRLRSWEESQDPGEILGGRKEEKEVSAHVRREQGQNKVKTS